MSSGSDALNAIGRLNRRSVGIFIKECSDPVIPDAYHQSGDAQSLSASAKMRGNDLPGSSDDSRSSSSFDGPDIKPNCFTPGTMIATPDGARPVEELRPGDQVFTRDNGVQEILWVGARAMTGAALDANRHLKPVRFARGSLGDGLPDRDMYLSPNHRVLVANDKTALYFEEPEVFVAAKYLTALDGVSIASPRWTTYIHFMCARHEVVLSEGAWSESFQPDDYSLQGIGNAQRLELQEMFPELDMPRSRASYQAARRSLKRYEAELLTRG
jgi:hypothetical protein